MAGVEVRLLQMCIRDRATDYCGVRSGRDTDKWADMGLTKEKASEVSVPLIRECPVNLECRVVRVDELGSHHMLSLIHI